MSDIAVPDRPEQRATRAAFFIAGFGMAAWAPLIPYVQQRLAIGDRTLGLLLLCLGAGSIGMMVVSGALAGRYGCRLVIVGAGLVICAALPFLAVAESPLALAGGILAFGAGLGTVDVVVNLQAVLIEKASGRALMSGFHAMFSIGAMAGAGMVSALLWAGASPLSAAMAASTAILALLAASAKHLLPHRTSANGAPFLASPRGWVLVIGCLCFIVFLAEGAMLDWSAVFLTSVRGVDAAHSGLGYAAFAVAMAAGRLCGDRLVQAVGPRPILRFGGLCAAAGLVLAVAVPFWIAALVGFAMVGLGAANVEPVLYSAVGRQTRMPQNHAIAAVTTIGYSGILAGPAAIGFISSATSLSFAFLCVAASVLVVSASSGLVARRSPDALAKSGALQARRPP